MTDKEIEDLAKKGIPLPENATLADMLLYQNLRLLYREYREGIISKEQGKIFKNQIISQYGVEKLREQCIQNEYERWRKYQVIQVEAEKNGCPICKKIVRIFDGREQI